MQAPSFKLDGVIKTREENADFEGPLDLILHLLSVNKIEIKDIQISLILRQYVDYINRMQWVDLETESAFVAMAAHLVYLKTKMLLAAGEEEALGEVAELIRSLEERSRMVEYQQMKQGAEYLAARSDIGRDTLVKPPVELTPDKTYRASHVPDELAGAVLRVFNRSRAKLPPPANIFRVYVESEEFPVDSKVNELLQRFIFVPSVELEELVSGCRSRSELVALFLAILELFKENRIEIALDGDDCTITAVRMDKAADI